MVSDVMAVFEKYGFLGLLILVFVYFIYSGIKTGWFNRLFTKISDKWIEKFMKEKTKGINNHITLITESDVVNHDIFNYIDIWMCSKIPTMKFSTEYRTVVFRKYLLIYLRVHKRKIQEFITDYDYKGMDESKLWKSFLNLINEITIDYEKEMIEYGIPNIIIEKMRERNIEMVDLMLDLTENICSSKFYNSPDNLLKVFSLLNIKLSVLENAIANSESVCNSINGQLKGRHFIDNNTGIDVIEP